MSVLKLRASKLGAFQRSTPDGDTNVAQTYQKKRRFQGTLASLHRDVSDNAALIAERIKQCLFVETLLPPAVQEQQSRAHVSARLWQLDQPDSGKSDRPH